MHVMYVHVQSTSRLSSESKHKRNEERNLGTNEGSTESVIPNRIIICKSHPVYVHTLHVLTFNRLLY